MAFTVEIKMLLSCLFYTLLLASHQIHDLDLKICVVNSMVFWWHWGETQAVQCTIVYCVYNNFLCPWLNMMFHSFMLEFNQIIWPMLFRLMQHCLYTIHTTAYIHIHKLYNACQYFDYKITIIIIIIFKIKLEDTCLHESHWSK